MTTGWQPWFLIPSVPAHYLTHPLNPHQSLYDHCGLHSIIFVTDGVRSAFLRFYLNTIVLKKVWNLQNLGKYWSLRFESRGRVLFFLDFWDFVSYSQKAGAVMRARAWPTNFEKKECPYLGLIEVRRMHNWFPPRSRFEIWVFGAVFGSFRSTRATVFSGPSHARKFDFTIPRRPYRVSVVLNRGNYNFGTGKSLKAEPNLTPYEINGM